MRYTAERGEEREAEKAGFAGSERQGGRGGYVKRGRRGFGRTYSGKARLSQKWTKGRIRLTQKKEIKI